MTYNGLNASTLDDRLEEERKMVEESMVTVPGYSGPRPFSMAYRKLDDDQRRWVDSMMSIDDGEWSGQDYFDYMARPKGENLQLEPGASDATTFKMKGVDGELSFDQALDHLDADDRKRLLNMQLAYGGRLDTQKALDYLVNEKPWNDKIKRTQDKFNARLEAAENEMERAKMENARNDLLANQGDWRHIEGGDPLSNVFARGHAILRGDTKDPGYADAAGQVMEELNDRMQDFAQSAWYKALPHADKRKYRESQSVLANALSDARQYASRPKDMGLVEEAERSMWRFLVGNVQGLAGVVDFAYDLTGWRHTNRLGEGAAALARDEYAPSQKEDNFWSLNHFVSTFSSGAMSMASMMALGPVGLPMMAMSSGGEQYSEAKEDLLRKNPNMSRAELVARAGGEAILAGATTWATEHLSELFGMGLIPGMPAKTNVLGAATRKGWRGVLSNMAKAWGAELLEEEVENNLQDFYKQIFRGEGEQFKDGAKGWLGWQARLFADSGIGTMTAMAGGAFDRQSSGIHDVLADADALGDYGIKDGAMQAYVRHGIAKAISGDRRSAAALQSAMDEIATGEAREGNPIVAAYARQNGLTFAQAADKLKGEAKASGNVLGQILDNTRAMGASEMLRYASENPLGLTDAGDIRMEQLGDDAWLVSLAKGNQMLGAAFVGDKASALALQDLLRTSWSQADEGVLKDLGEEGGDVRYIGKVDGKWTLFDDNGGKVRELSEDETARMEAQYATQKGELPRSGELTEGNGHVGMYVGDQYMYNGRPFSVSYAGSGRGGRSRWQIRGTTEDLKWAADKCKSLRVVSNDGGRMTVEGANPRDALLMASRRDALISLDGHSIAVQYIGKDEDGKAKWAVLAPSDDMKWLSEHGFDVAYEDETPVIHGDNAIASIRQAIDPDGKMEETDGFFNEAAMQDYLSLANVLPGPDSSKGGVLEYLRGLDPAARSSALAYFAEEGKPVAYFVQTTGPDGRMRRVFKVATRHQCVMDIVEAGGKPDQIDGRYYLLQANGEDSMPIGQEAYKFAMWMNGETEEGEQEKPEIGSAASVAEQQQADNIDSEYQEAVADAAGQGEQEGQEQQEAQEQQEGADSGEQKKAAEAEQPVEKKKEEKPADDKITKEDVIDGNIASIDDDIAAIEQKENPTDEDKEKLDALRIERKTLENMKSGQMEDDDADDGDNGESGEGEGDAKAELDQMEQEEAEQEKEEEKKEEPPQPPPAEPEKPADKTEQPAAQEIPIPEYIEIFPKGTTLGFYLGAVRDDGRTFVIFNKSGEKRFVYDKPTGRYNAETYANGRKVSEGPSFGNENDFREYIQQFANKGYKIGLLKSDQVETNPEESKQETKEEKWESELPGAKEDKTDIVEYLRQFDGEELQKKINFWKKSTKSGEPYYAWVIRMLKDNWIVDGRKLTKEGKTRTLMPEAANYAAWAAGKNNKTDEPRMSTREAEQKAQDALNRLKSGDLVSVSVTYPDATDNYVFSRGDDGKLFHTNAKGFATPATDAEINARLASSLLNNAELSYQQAKQASTVENKPEETSAEKPIKDIDTPSVKYVARPPKGIKWVNNGKFGDDVTYTGFDGDDAYIKVRNGDHQDNIKILDFRNKTYTQIKKELSDWAGEDVGMFDRGLDALMDAGMKSGYVKPVTRPMSSSANEKPASEKEEGAEPGMVRVGGVPIINADEKHKQEREQRQKEARQIVDALDKGKKAILTERLRPSRETGEIAKNADGTYHVHLNASEYSKEYDHDWPADEQFEEALDGVLGGNALKEIVDAEPSASGRTEEPEKTQDAMSWKDELAKAVQKPWLTADEIQNSGEDPQTIAQALAFIHGKDGNRWHQISYYKVKKKLEEKASNPQAVEQPAKPAEKPQAKNGSQLSLEIKTPLEDTVSSTDIVSALRDEGRTLVMKREGQDWPILTLGFNPESNLFERKFYRENGEDTSNKWKMPEEKFISGLEHARKTFDDLIMGYADEGKSEQHSRQTEARESQAGASANADMDALISEGLDELKELGEQWKKSMNNLSSNPGMEQLEILAKMSVPCAKIGYAFVVKGIRNFGKWVDAMDEKLHALLKGYGMDDDDIAGLIRDAWTSDYTDGERTMTVEEWAKTLGEQSGNAEENTADEKPVDKPATEGEPQKTTPTKSEPKGENFLIPADEPLIPGSSQDVRIRANIEAIRLLKKLEAENRPATNEEKLVLMKFTSWGGLQPAFRYGEKYYTDLKELLTPEEYSAAHATILDAFYTDKPVIAQMWRAATLFGFKGGRVGEFGAGVGHFLGMVPPELASSTQFTSVELDNITAGILRKLYPQTKVVNKGLESTRIGDGTLDMVIGNFPFGSTRLQSHYGTKYAPMMVHDYFFVRALDAVRPGGFVIALTSHGTMDKTDPMARMLMGDKANLVGIVRLPETAFRKNAGTSVVTDIVVLQKKQQGDSRPDRSFQEVSEITIDGETVRRNAYFDSHPNMILGKESLTGSMYRAHDYTVEATEGDLEGKIQGAFDELQKEKPVRMTDDAAADEVDYDDEHRDGFLYLDADGGLTYNIKGVPTKFMIQTTVKGKKAYRSPTADEVAVFKSLVKLNSAYTDVLTAMQEGATDEELNAKREIMKRVYDGHVSRYGTLNSRKHSVFRGDPRYARVQALEKYEKKQVKDAKGRLVEKVTVLPGDVFSKRTIMAETAPSHVNELQDAVALSYRHKGEIDVDFMAGLLGREADEVENMLLASGDYYRNPETEEVESADDYLSGNVVEKLRIASEASTKDPGYQRNMEALTAVRPKRKRIQDLGLVLGQSWIPGKTISDFLMSKYGVSVSVAYHPSLNSMATKGEWKTSHVGGVLPVSYDIGNKNLMWILDRALNKGEVRIDDAVIDDYGKTKMVPNKELTKQAMDLVKKLNAEFEKYAKTDQAASQVLEDVYNDTVNVFVPRKFREGESEFYPGANHDIHLRGYQRRAVERMLRGNTLLDHCVGAGKTFTMITAAMTLKYQGKASKSMIVVQNSTINSFANDARKLYPGAKILAATEEDLAAKNRARFLASVAAGDWDIVIIPQSSFDLLPNNPRETKAFYESAIEQLETMQQEKAAEQRGGRKKDSDIQRAIKSLQERLAKLLAADKKDYTMTFDELGIDALFIDEAHEYRKNFFITGRNRIKGLDKNSSAKAANLYLKIENIRRKKGNHNVFFATGTPIVNTLTELWNMERYLRPDVLAAYHVETFDEFADMFCVVDNEMEYDAGGRVKFYDRFSKYQNCELLGQMWREAADVLLSSDPAMQEIPRPKITGGKPDLKLLDKSPVMEAFMKFAADTLNWFEHLPGKEKMRPENMAVPMMIYGMARRATVDMRLIDSHLPDVGGKVSTAVPEIMKTYKETESEKGAQVVFVDSISKDKFNVQEELKRKLVEAGIPAEQIAVVNAQKTKKDARQAIFDKVNSGDVRVVIGHSQVLGVGVNIQERLKRAHFLDPTQTPALMEQRLGRIVRFGNIYPEVDVTYYAITNTLDATMYQTLARKAHFIEQVRMGGVDSFIEDSDSADYKTVAAMANGNPDILELAKTQRSIQELTMRRSAYYQQRGGLLWDEESDKRDIERYERYIAEDSAFASRHANETFEKVTLIDKDGKRHEFDKSEAKEYLKAMWQGLGDKVKGEKDGAVEIADIVMNGVKVRFSAIVRTNYSTGDKEVVYSNAINGDAEAEKTNYGGHWEVMEKSPTTALDSIRNRLTGFDSFVERQKNQLDLKKEHLRQTQEELAKPFDGDKELETLQAKETELLGRVGAAADDNIITKRPKLADYLKGVVPGIDENIDIDFSGQLEDTAPDLDEDEDSGVSYRESDDGNPDKYYEFGDGSDDDSELQPVLEAMQKRFPGVKINYLYENELPDAIQNLLDHDRNQGKFTYWKGFYYNGKIYINPLTATSRDDVVTTIMHEAGVHFGLKQLFSDKAEYAKFLDTMQDIPLVASRMGKYTSKGYGRAEAVEEVVGEIADKYYGSPMWKRLWTTISDFFKKMLGKIGIDVELDETQIREIVKASVKAAETADVNGDGVADNADYRALDEDGKYFPAPDEWGTAYTSMTRGGVEAVRYLINKKDGFVPGAFHRDDLGDIDIVYGRTTDDPGDKGGYGLAHIMKRHPDMTPEKLANLVENGTRNEDEDNISAGRVYLHDGENRLVVSLSYNEMQRKWVVTSFKETTRAAAGYNLRPTDSTGARHNGSPNGDNNIRLSGDMSIKYKAMGVSEEDAKERLAEARKETKQWFIRMFSPGDYRGGVIPTVNKMLKKAQWELCAQSDEFKHVSDVELEAVKSISKEPWRYDVMEAMVKCWNGLIAAADLATEVPHFDDPRVRKIMEIELRKREIVDWLSSDASKIAKLSPAMRAAIMNHLGTYHLRAYEIHHDPNYRPTNAVKDLAVGRIISELEFQIEATEAVISASSEAMADAFKERYAKVQALLDRSFEAMGRMLDQRSEKLAAKLAEFDKEIDGLIKQRDANKDAGEKNRLDNKIQRRRRAKDNLARRFNAQTDKYVAQREAVQNRLRARRDSYRWQNIQPDLYLYLKTRDESVLIGKARPFVNRAHAFAHMMDRITDRVNGGVEMLLDDADQIRLEGNARVVRGTAMGIVERILGANRGDDQFAVNMDIGPSFRVIQSSFIRRKDIAPEIRKLLGEIEDIGRQFAMTVGKLSRIVVMDRMYRELWESQKGLDNDDANKIFFTGAYVKKNGKSYSTELKGAKYGMLEGMFTDYETKRMLDGYSEPQGKAGRIYTKVIGTMRYFKTVLNPPTHFRNLLGNVSFAACDGEMFRVDYWKKNMGRAFRVLTRTDDESRQERQRLMRLGLIGSGAHSQEIANIADSLGLTDADFDIMSTPGKLLSLARKLQGFAEFAYALEDNLFRLAALYTKEQRGIDTETAVRRIRDLYPTYDMAPVLVSEFARYNPFIKDFIIFKAEAMRCFYNSFKYMAHDMKEGDIRSSIGLLLTLAAATQLGQLLLGGVAKAMRFWEDRDKDREMLSPPDILALRKLLPDYRTDNLILPWRVDKDVIKYIDGGYIYPYDYLPMLSAEISSGGKPGRTTAELGKRLVVDPVFGGMGLDLFSALYVGRNPMTGRLLKTESGGYTGYIAKSFAPSAWIYAARGVKLLFSEEGRYTTSSGEEITWGNELAKTVLPFRATTLNIPTAYRIKMRRLCNEVSESQAKANAAWRKYYAGQGLKMDAEAAEKAAQAAFDGELGDLLADLEGAGGRFLTRDQRDQLLKDAGFSAAKREAILEGRRLSYERPEPPDAKK